MHHRTGQCSCGHVGLTVRGEPVRTGVCHCTDCRKESGSAFTFYGVWPIDQFQHTGLTVEFRGRRFCKHCGSRLFSADEQEVEIKLGILDDAPTALVPRYELWTKRREVWLQAIDGAEQHWENRP